MQQEPLFVEDMNEALRATVQALGGPKKVGYELRPTLGIEGAASWVRDCLNPDRRQEFDPNDIQTLLRMARSHGVHVLATFMLRDAGYAEPQPVEPDDEKAALLRRASQTVADLKTLLPRLERAVAASNAAGVGRR